MNNEPNSVVTVEQFVTTLIQNNSNIPPTDNYLQYGYDSGWLEDMDITGNNEPLLRKNAARIIHEFMRIELQESDLEDVSCASKLRDLYDCRVCTKHIMQVYAKGIMEGFYASDTLYLFGLKEAITTTEASVIISRVFHTNHRISNQ